MAITDTLGRLTATFVAMAQTRLALAAVEVEEESQRLLGYLLQALLALFLFGIAIVLVALCVIIVFWDTHRVQAVLGMAALFAVLGAVLAARVKASIAAKPALLAHTLAELGKDIDFVKTVSHTHDN
jgi:uncharacterized membrane protein YqjE